ncbi:MAG: type I-C CRISPR-associated protein Cas8c/Csd1 [Alphaproteobacteria bacterium]|nr:type I-C CRISPR-associated protein Cas8c/Csd1 [Alphaproteobacteria bacterium]MBV9862449.1 type I-C CRISPR-associated protein Cas8c/Csd1 [Alphaproteobacteria bacterium]
MTVLQSLDRYYGRMAARNEAEPPGYSREKISFAIVLSAEGEPIEMRDLRQTSGKRLMPRLIEVPAAVKRTAGIFPNLLWDKTAYVLGRTAGEGRRTAEEHTAFKKANLALLDGAEDEGLIALRRFLEKWSPARFDAEPFGPEMLDANIVFRLEGELAFIHERYAARRLVEARVGGDGPSGFCLVTGIEAPLRRLHPPIKGVEGAQTAGAALVSFNLDAFESYGKEQGANAPTSEAAAFRYGAALNRMLDRGSRNRIRRPIGDTTVVFWADTSDAVDEAAAQAAEDLFFAAIDPAAADEHSDEDAAQAATVRDALDKLAAGRPVRDLDPRLGLQAGTRFHVLGLAPNAARLSVRYWLDDTFEIFAKRLGEHYRDLAIEPAPWKTKLPAVRWLLVKATALQEKYENIPHQLSGEVMRAILAGTPYPHTLLTAAINRLRAGDDPGTGWHAAVIHAVLARDQRLRFKKENWLVSLERDYDDSAYQLGRLFAAVETAQRMALGRVNATIRDRYFGAASATPASVFPLLLRGAQNHLGKLRKEGKGGWLEREIEEISDHLKPDLPRSLRLESQGRFAIGYYHQRKAQYAGRPADEIDEEGADNGTE